MSDPETSAPDIAAAEAPLDPATAAGEAYPLHPNAVKLWRAQAFILGALALFPTGFIALVSGNALWFALGLAVALFIGVFGARYSRRYAERFRCLLLEDGLLAARGVWWRRESFIPRPRIQHTDVNEGPIARRFGIAALKVYTAGTQLGSIDIDGLPREDAYRLRDRLLGRGHDAV